MAARPTLLDAAVINTGSPRFSPPKVTSASVGRQILHPDGGRFDGRKF